MSSRCLRAAWLELQIQDVQWFIIIKKHVFFLIMTNKHDKNISQTSIKKNNLDSNYRYGKKLRFILITKVKSMYYSLSWLINTIKIYHRHMSRIWTHIHSQRIKPHSQHIKPINQVYIGVSMFISQPTLLNKYIHPDFETSLINHPPSIMTRHLHTYPMWCFFFMKSFITNASSSQLPSAFKQILY